MEPNNNQQNFTGIAYAVIVMRTGDKLYYTRDEAQLFASIADDYIAKRLTYLGVHNSLEDMISQTRQTLVLTKMEEVESIQYHGVFVGRQGEGQPHFAEFQLG